ncbi:glutamine amidotransferase subunit PdxT [Candidatus Micrarchaeota archaeon CG1_02_47_40]|nr:MAG: glutamine amidotransferase subunit PdxT [Candidatus Micrarchaeota archaeon CG1_02_47_40]
MQKVGVLALQGDVSEHVSVLKKAAQESGIEIDVVEVRTCRELSSLDALIIPGGESTTLSLLMEREGMFEEVKKIRKIFGTCAGAIMLAKKVRGAEEGQKFLGLVDIEVSRNAYGPQTESFEAEIESGIGRLKAVFIRAPVIERVWGDAKVLAEFAGKPVAVEERVEGKSFLAITFHPEINGETKFHEHFLRM